MRVNLAYLATDQVHEESLGLALVARARIATVDRLSVILVTDIVGSTPLARAAGGRWPRILGRHRLLLEEASARHGGTMASDTGDGLIIVFPSLTSAVVAAVECQRGLTIEPWPEGLEVQVRMAIHRGAVGQSQGRFVGVGLHEGARLAAMAGAGQVLVSGDSIEGLPAGVDAVDLGNHLVRDFPTPVRLWLLEAPGLARMGPVDVADPSRTSERLVGRSEAILALRDLLTVHRIVTIVGPGGSGKTTLGLAVAMTHPGEVDAVDVATVPPELVATAVFDAVAMRRLGAAAPADVATLIGHRRLLLVIDNAERRLEPVARLVEGLVRACPNVTVLVTSREPLGLAAEWPWPLPLLKLPDAVELFVRRARRVRPVFAPSPPDRRVVEEICEQVGRLPLAIELAASRTRSLGLGDIAARLANQMGLLVSTERGGPARHRSMEAAIRWSTDLLSLRESTLLGLLACFADGASLAGLQAAAGDTSDVDLIDDLDDLIAKSLVEASGFGGRQLRYRLLEPVRQFALARLGDDEERAARDRLAGWVLELARRIAPDPATLTPRWRDTLDAEQGNIAQSVTHLIDRGNTSGALLVVGAFGYYWLARGSRRGLLLTDEALQAAVWDRTAPRSSLQPS